MEYYIIKIDMQSTDMTIIVNAFGKFWCNRFPIVMCNSGDIFQEKL